MSRVVLDTNVLVAAARSRQGASFALLQALRADRFRLLASVEDHPSFYIAFTSPFSISF
jgi:predicted nucleic acid-binding protein